jgi:excisionase family DNA binding protein
MYWLLTIEKLATYLKASKTTLYKPVWEGNIPSQKSAGAGISEKEPLTTGLQKSK